MSNLIKENNIFEEVEKRCQSFIESDPLLNAYRKKEWNDYFYKDELAKEKEKGIEIGMKEGKLEGIKEGKLEGIKEGKLSEQKSMAKAMKSDGADINLISKYTGLSIEEIKKL